MTGSADSAKNSLRFDSLEQEVFLGLWRTYDRLKALEDEVFAPYELSAQQYNTLRLLRSAHPGSMPTLVLANRLISRAPDITRLLDRLERRGLLRRDRQQANRRVVEVTITAQGLELLGEIHNSVQECHRRQLGHLDEKALRQLAKLLHRARQPHEDEKKLSFVDQ